MIRSLIPLLLTGAIAAVAAIAYYFRPDLRPRAKGGPPETPLSIDGVRQNPTLSSHGIGEISSDCGTGGGDSGGGCDGGGGG